jgi:hypothetical protein
LKSPDRRKFLKRRKRQNERFYAQLRFISRAFGNFSFPQAFIFFRDLDGRIDPAIAAF